MAFLKISFIFHTMNLDAFYWKRLSFVSCLLMGLALCDGIAAAAAVDKPDAPSPSILHEVIFENPQTQMVQVVTRISSLDDVQNLDLELPSWRPGKYLILDKAGLIQEESATDESGVRLPVRKTAKNVWRIDRSSSAGNEVWFSYRMYADSIHDRTLYVDAHHAFLSGSAIFMNYSPIRSQPVCVQFQMPEGWEVATGLKQLDDKTWTAPNYDILVDSPIELGSHQRIEFSVQGKSHEVILWGDVDCSMEKLAQDLEKIVIECAEIWGGLPYERYVFLIHSAPGLGGGTEHWNSTIMQVEPQALEDESSYRKRFLPLAAHEFFHTWNVKRLRPAGLTPYDYSRENYTSLLWVSEGTTSYFEELILARAGLMEVKEVLDNWSGAVNQLFRSPGDAIQSVAASSFDSWIKFNRRHAHSSNSTVNFYHKGALVSLAMDLELRRAQTPEAKLENIMKLLFQNHPLSKGGFTEGDFQSLLNQTTDANWDKFWESYVDGFDPIPFDKLFPVIGLELGFQPREGEFIKFCTASPKLPQIAYWGLRMNGNMVRSVDSDGPCFLAGIHPDDEIVAINGKRFKSGSLDDAPGKWNPGDLVEVVFFRDDKLRTQSIRLGSQPDGKWTVRPASEPTESGKLEFQSLLGKPWPESVKSAPENN